MTRPGTPGDVDAAVVEKAAAAAVDAEDAYAVECARLWDEGGQAALDTLDAFPVVMARAVLAAVLPDVRAQALEDAAELADSVIVSWEAVPGLHPTAPEPHPAALRAAGARRTLTVLRSRMAEAFTDRIARAAADPEGPS